VHFFAANLDGEFGYHGLCFVAPPHQRLLSAQLVNTADYLDTPFREELVARPPPALHLSIFRSTLSHRHGREGKRTAC
jgi:hypothetical protein